MKKFISLIVFGFVLILLSKMYAVEIQKHYINAKVAYINFEFSKAEKEINLAYNMNEITGVELNDFKKLIKFINILSDKKYREASNLYRAGKYIEALKKLHDIFGSKGQDKNVGKLYLRITKKLSKKELKEFVNRINGKIKKYKSAGKDILLIPLYIEKIIMFPDDNIAQLELKKIMLKYKSHKIKNEVKKMIRTLKRLMKRPSKTLEKEYMLVNNVLYLEPNNKEVIRINERLDEIKLMRQRKGKNKSKIMPIKKVSHKSLPKTKIEVFKFINLKNDKSEVRKKVKKKIKEHKAEMHFNRGITRYYEKLYAEAKNEFLLARYYNPYLKDVNKYIKLTKEKEKQEKKHKNKILNRDVLKSKRLLKSNKSEQAISLIYNSIKSNNIYNKKARKILAAIVKKRITGMKKNVDKFDPLSRIVKMILEQAKFYYNKKENYKAICFIETLIELYPDNTSFITFLTKYYKSMDYKERYHYLIELYSKAMEYFYRGNYKKSFLFIQFIIKSKLRSEKFRDIYIVKSKCMGYINKDFHKINKIDGIYKSAVFDYIRKDYVNAINKWEYILKIEPWNIKARFNIDKVNNILTYRKRYANLSLMSENEINVAKKYYYKGIIAYNKGNYKKALEYFYMTLSVFPEYRNALNNIKKINFLIKVKNR